MSKLTYEDKKEIIRLYNEAGLGYSSISKKFNLALATVEIIVRKYNFHGEKSLKKSYNTVPPSIRMEIINRIKNGDSKISVCIEYMVTTTQITKWLKDYEENGYNGLKSKKKGRPPSMKKESKPLDPNDKDALIKQLQERNRELECEVEALKKLRALVQQRKPQPTKKKQ